MCSVQGRDATQKPNMFAKCNQAMLYVSHNFLLETRSCRAGVFVHKITNLLAVIRKIGCRNCTVSSGVNYSAGIQCLMSAINCPIKEVHVTECISSPRVSSEWLRNKLPRDERHAQQQQRPENTRGQADWWSRIRRDCAGADRLLVRWVSRGQGSPAARGSYASVTLTRRCWFWCDSLPPSGTGRSGNYYFGPISFDRNIHSARSARKVSVSVFLLKIATPPRTFGAIRASLFISSGSTDVGGWRSLSRTRSLREENGTDGHHITSQLSSWRA